jgi:hypothetical protein
MFRSGCEGKPVIPRSVFFDIYLRSLATSSSCRIESELYQTESEQHTFLVVLEIHSDLELRILFTKPATSRSFVPEVASPRVTTLRVTGVRSEPEP